MSDVHLTLWGKRLRTSPPSQEGTRFYPLLAMLYLMVTVTSLTLSPRLIAFNLFNHSNLIPMPGGLFVFPLNYYISDIITEVYGFARARQTIWFAIFCSLVFLLVTQLVIRMPTMPGWEAAKQYVIVFSAIPRIFISVLTAMVIGTFINDIIMSKLKVKFHGRHFWMRAIGSTVIGEMIVAIFGTIFSWEGLLHSTYQLIAMTISTCLFNILYQIVLLPIIFLLVLVLKWAEGIDVYDVDESYNPFSLDTPRDNHKK